MCVIVSNPAESKLDDARLSRLWDRNSDGGGFAYIDNENQIQVVKTLTKNEFIHKYKSARGRHKDAHFLLHMRIATHGSVSMENIHPFRVDQHTIMAHNGIISIESAIAEEELDRRVAEARAKADKEQKPVKMPNLRDDPWDRSDTRIFVEEMLPELPDNWLDNKMLVQMVEDFIGGSKLMFMTTNPELEHAVYILNADKGCERDGMWFSNNHGVDEPKALPSYGSAIYAKDMYKTPLPKVETKRTPAKPSYSMPAKLIKDPSTLSAERYLKARRLEKNLGNDIEFFSSLNSWMCFDCEDEVKVAQTGAGECSCYEKFCVNCNEMPMQCSCEVTDRKLVAFTADCEVIPESAEASTDFWSWWD